MSCLWVSRSLPIFSDGCPPKAVISSPAAWACVPAGWSNTRKAVRAVRRFVAADRPAVHIVASAPPGAAALAATDGAVTVRVTEVLAEADDKDAAKSLLPPLTLRVTLRRVESTAPAPVPPKIPSDTAPPVKFFAMGVAVVGDDGAAGAASAVTQEVAVQTAPVPGREPVSERLHPAVRTATHVHFMASGNAVSLQEIDRHGGDAPSTRKSAGSLLPPAWENPGSAPGGGDEASEASSTSGSVAAAAAAGAPVRAPIPSKVVRCEKQTGATVAAGDVVVVLESMKMETKVTAPSAGTVTVHVKPNQVVQARALLFSIA